MPTTFNQIYTQEVIDTMLGNLRSEFGGSAKVFYGDTFKKNSNKSIKLSIINQSHKEVNDDMFLNNYDIEIKYYVILNNTSQIAYKTFFYDMHRIEQSLLAIIPTTDYLNFKINSISINDYEEDEENIPGLYLANFLISFSLLKG
jgi:hypothetical protein